MDVTISIAAQNASPAGWCEMSIRPVVGVTALIIAPDAHPGCVLVGERCGAHGTNTWATPGGHLEFGEEWNGCAAREVKEETGLEIDPAIMRHVYTTNNVFVEEGKHSITLFMVASLRGKEIPIAQRMEPDKCRGWTWMSWHELQSRDRDGTLAIFPSLRTLLRDSTFCLATA